MLQKPWFKNKTYGWGWQPATWQGWGVMLGWLIVEFGFILYAFMRVGSSPQFPLWIVIISFSSAVILLIIAWLTGEKPRWQWGDKK